MRQVKALVFVLVFGVTALGQSNKATVSSQSTAQTQRELADVRGRLAQVEKKIDLLESQLKFDEYVIGTKQERQDSITLNLTEREYQRLDTSNGFFLVAVEEVVPYLNGYKISVSIGNPAYAKYNGFKVKVSWGKKYAPAQYTEASFSEWQKTIQEKETSMTNILEPGTWNKAEIIVAPATADDLGYVTFSMTASNVVLYVK